MIKRSKFKSIIQNPTLLHISADSKFFFSEEEAKKYQSSIKGQSKIDQWCLHLDDATDEELKQRLLDAENSIKEREDEQMQQFGNIFINDSQKKLIRSYADKKDVWSVSFISNKTSNESLLEGTDFGTYDDEVNGATPVLTNVEFTKEETFEQDGVKITVITKDNKPNTKRFMRVFYLDDEGSPESFSCLPDSSNLSINHQFDYVKSIINFDKAYAGAMLKNFVDFFEKRKLVSPSGISKEAGFSSRYLPLIIKEEKPITKNAVKKILPILRKYGFEF